MKTNRVHCIWSYCKKHLGLFLLAEICIVVTYTVAVLLPLNLTFLSDEVLGKGQFNLVWVALRNYLVLFAVSCLFNLLYAFAWQTLSNQYVVDIKTDLFSKTIRAKAAWLSSVSSGDMMTRIDIDSDQFLNVIQRNVFHTLNSIIMCIGIVIIVWNMDPIIALLLVVTAVLPIIIIRLLGYFTQKIAKAERAIDGKLQGRLYEMLTAMRDIRISSGKSWSMNQLLSSMQALIQKKNQRRWIAFLSDKFVSLVHLAASLIMYFYCAFLVAEGKITVGIFLALIQYTALLNRKMNWILRLYLEWFGRKASIDRVTEVLALESENKEEGRADITQIEALTFSNVHMSYDRNQVLHGVSFAIQKGERVALVGGSGSGKTTIVDLIVRLYEPQSGDITLNGRNVREYDLSQLRRHIGVLSQRIMLFKASVRENLLYGNEPHSDEELWHVCDELGIGDCIRQAPNGLDTIISSKGFDLSGGQKQRLMIARLLLKKLDMLILDEATSALDVETEKMVLDLFDQRNKDITMLIVSHRREAVMRCNRIIVIKDGVSLDEGEHESLLSRCPYYHMMFGEKTDESVSAGSI